MRAVSASRKHPAWLSQNGFGVVAGNLQIDRTKLVEARLARAMSQEEAANQLHAGQTTPQEVLQEVRPEDLGFAGADMQSDNLAPPVGIDCHSNYGRNTDDAATFPDFEIGGVEPEVWLQRYHCTDCR